MTMKHKVGELEEQELLQELRDGYITKQEYEARLKVIRSYQKITRTKDKRDTVEDFNNE